MTEPGHTCNFCEKAPAVTSVLRRPACGGCGEAIGAFFRGELQGVIEEGAKGDGETVIPRAPKGYSLDVRESAGDVDERGCPPDPAPASSVDSCAGGDGNPATSRPPARDTNPLTCRDDELPPQLRGWLETGLR